VPNFEKLAGRICERDGVNLVYHLDGDFVGLFHFFVLPSLTFCLYYTTLEAVKKDFRLLSALSGELLQLGLGDSRKVDENLFGILAVVNLAHLLTIPKNGIVGFASYGLPHFNAVDAVQRGSGGGVSLAFILAIPAGVLTFNLAESLSVVIGVKVKHCFFLLFFFSVLIITFDF
jgi:hypothetical protein